MRAPLGLLLVCLIWTSATIRLNAEAVTHQAERGQAGVDTSAGPVDLSSGTDELSAPGQRLNSDCSEAHCLSGNTVPGENVRSIESAAHEGVDAYQSSLASLTQATQQAAASVAAVPGQAAAVPALPGLKRVKVVHVVSPQIDGGEENADSDGDIVAQVVYPQETTVGGCDCTNTAAQPLHCANHCLSKQAATKQSSTRLVIPTAKSACTADCDSNKVDADAAGDLSTDSSIKHSGMKLNSARVAPPREHPVKINDKQVGTALKELRSDIEARIRRRHNHLARLLGIPKDALRGRAEAMEHHHHATLQGYYQRTPKAEWKSADALDPGSSVATIPDPMN